MSFVPSKIQMVHPDEPISNIKGLGKVYATQTICACQSGTVAGLCQHVAKFIRADNAEDKVFEWACECARNPRAGQTAENGYVVPQYNAKVARTLIETLVHATANRNTFDKERHQIVPSSAWLMTLNGVLKKIPVQKKSLVIASSKENEKEILTTSPLAKKEPSRRYGKIPRPPRSNDRKPREAA